MLLLHGCHGATPNARPRSAQEVTAEVWLGGDVFLGDAHAPLWDPMPLELEGIAGVVNLEGPVTTQAAAADAGLRLGNALESLSLLKHGGVRAVGVANNHALDLGEAGRHTSRQLLRANSMLAADDAVPSAVLILHGFRVGVFQADLSHGLPVDLRARLNAAARHVDALLCSFHVTGPPSYLPSSALQEAVGLGVEQGCDVVASHGSHSVAALEWRGRVLVAWGLGNLRFACACTDETDGLVLRVHLAAHRVLWAQALPVEAGLLDRPARLHPKPQEVRELLQGLGSSPMDAEGVMVPMGSGTQHE